MSIPIYDGGRLVGGNVEDAYAGEAGQVKLRLKIVPTPTLCTRMHDRRPPQTSRARRNRAAGRGKLTRGPDDDPGPEPPPPAPQPISREERERLIAEHTRPEYLHQAFRDLGVAVEAIAPQFDEAWPCHKCLTTMLVVVAIYAGIDRLQELLGQGGEQ